MGPTRGQNSAGNIEPNFPRNSFRKAGEFAEAKRCYRRAARLATDSPEEAYFNLGLILRAEGRHKEALKWFNKAIKVDANTEAAKVGRADILVRESR